MPKFSIIIPLFNKEKDIKNTLNSVLNQSFTDFEIIIIDDGSTDNSITIVNSFDDKRIRLFSKENEGVSIARNFGVEKSNSKHIVFLDADDFWYANHLENLNFLINKFPNYKWYASAYEKKRNNKLTTPMNAPIMKKGGNWYGVVEDFFENSYIDCLAWTSAVCFKKSFYQELNGFNPNFTHGEDTDLWIRAALKSPLVFSTKITSRHNLISGNRSSEVSIDRRIFFNSEAFLQAEKENASLKKYLDLNRFSLAIQQKLSDNLDNFKQYSEKIDLKNLSKKQRFLLKQNKSVLSLLINLKNRFEKAGFRISSFS